MAFDEKKLRTFLVQTPKPARIVVHVDDDTREIVVPPTGKTWAHIAQSIVALGDVKCVECYDAQNSLLRATRGEEDERQAQAARNVALNVPPHTDPETARFIHFSNLLHRSTEFCVGVAFEKMVRLFEMQNERMVAIETRLERTEGSYRRTMEERLRDAFAEAERIAREANEGEPPPNPLFEMAQAFMGGMHSAQPPHNDASDTLRPPARAVARNGSNGKHHHHPPPGEVAT